MSGGRRRWWRDHWLDVIFDVVPPVVLLALGLVDALTGALTIPIGNQPAVSALIPGAIACLALLLRRYRPLLTLAIVLVATVLPPLVLPVPLTYWDEFVVWVVALYSCARHLTRARAFLALGVSVLALVALPFEFADLRDTGDLLFNSVFLIAGFCIGLLARSWAASRERVLRAALERAVAEERAGRRERARIARELHDVIAHTITVIVMQAGGARMASASDPAVAVSTLAQIEDLGRRSLAELRSLLPLLGEAGEGETDDDAAAGVASQPDLGTLGELCERMRGLGLPVRLDVEAGLADVPIGLQLTAYRVVQEGLTNVIRHAGMVDTVVGVSRAGDPEVLVVEVGNAVPVEASRAGRPGGPGVPGGLAGLGGGRGLRGLEERVRLEGGEFTAGPSGDGRFRLHVELPLGGAR